MLYFLSHDSFKMFLIKLEIHSHRVMDAAGTFVADTLTFHMPASFPYTTAILFTLFLCICSRSVSFNSSATNPIKELSGVCAARRQCQEKVVNEDAADLQTAEQKYIMHCNIMHWVFLGNYKNYSNNIILITIDYFKRSCHQLNKLCVSVPKQKHNSTALFIGNYRTQLSEHNTTLWLGTGNQLQQRDF